MTSLAKTERRITVRSPIGLRPTDTLTGLAPFGAISDALDLEQNENDWRRTELQATVSPAGVWGYPGLEHHPDPVGRPTRRYRIRLDCEFYVPGYRAARDGYEFDAPPTNGTLDPGAVTVPIALALYPAPNYPFQPHVPVLRGRVIDGEDKPVRDVQVAHALNEKTVTTTNGEFALPVTLPATSMSWTLDAADLRGDRVGSVTITVPDQLHEYQTITVS